MSDYHEDKLWVIIKTIIMLTFDISYNMACSILSLHSAMDDGDYHDDDLDDGFVGEKNGNANIY